jgi:hypothetical protein
MGKARASRLDGKVRWSGPALKFLAAAVVIAALAILSQFEPALAEMPDLQYQQLPADLRNYVEGVRQSCKELDGEFKPYNLMQGITVVALDTEGSRDLLVDAEELCNARMAGANCTNRGCDLKIWKEVGQRSWRKIFDEHLHRKFISTSEQGRLKLMVVSVYAGSPRCGPLPGRNYTSGQSCDAMVRYRNGSWIWEKIQ